MGNQYLPEQVISEILSWTKVTSLFRFKSVCKSWRSIISKPKFIQAHHPTSSLLFITSKANDHRTATIIYSDCCSRVSLPLPRFFDAKRFVSSCNGIVCVCDRIGDNIYLSNPLTRMCKQLPHGVREEAITPFKVDVAFGFDCFSCDFKVLRIKYEKEQGDSLLVRVSFVELYSSNADSWREIDIGCMLLRSFVLCPCCPVLISGPVLDGVLYLEGMNEIVTFDLSSQVFRLIPFPDSFKGRKSNVLDVDGSVAVVVESVGDGLVDKEISLWTMKTVSDEVFWNKTFIFDSGFKVDWVFLYLGAKQFVVRTKLGEMLYDHSKKETKRIPLPSQSYPTKVLKHAESFVSIQGFEQVGENWM